MGSTLSARAAGTGKARNVAVPRGRGKRGSLDDARKAGLPDGGGIQAQPGYGAAHIRRRRGYSLPAAGEVSGGHTFLNAFAGKKQRGHASGGSWP